MRVKLHSGSIGLNRPRGIPNYQFTIAAQAVAIVGVSGVEPCSPLKAFHVYPIAKLGGQELAAGESQVKAGEPNCNGCDHSPPRA
jgi:hypothetical protein